MIIDRRRFDFEGKCLIEKVVVQAPFRFTVNFPNEACFIHFTEGSSRVSSPYEQVHVEAEESVLLKCGSYFADLIKNSEEGEYEIIVIHLYPDILRAIYKNEIPSFVKRPEKQPFVQKLAAQDVVRKFIESLYFYFETPALVSEELLALKVKELVLLLIQTRSASSIEKLFADLFAPREVSVKEVVNNHIFSYLTVEDLARLANLSLSTFNRAFHKLFNETPANYIKLKRLERARELLEVSPLTISEIAFQTCYSDIGHFSRSFKIQYGLPPSEYRRLKNAAAR